MSFMGGLGAQSTLNDLNYLPGMTRTVPCEWRIESLGMLPGSVDPICVPKGDEQLPGFQGMSQNDLLLTEWLYDSQGREQCIGPATPRFSERYMECFDRLRRANAPTMEERIIDIQAVLQRMEARLGEMERTLGT